MIGGTLCNRGYTLYKGMYFVIGGTLRNRGTLCDRGYTSYIE